MKLLIADDNAKIRWLVRLFCANVATEMRDCADGNEAIEAFAAFQPDWTIMDLGLPRLDGLSAIKQILTNHPDARIVVVTQYTGPEYEQAAREAGACAFVCKNNLIELLKVLSRKSSDVGQG